MNTVLEFTSSFKCSPIANFRDSKEIMMTSDSENNFEISATRGNRSTGTTPLQPAASILVAVSTEPPQEKVVAAVCAPHELRCVSGKCITVNQLCDRVSHTPGQSQAQLYTKLYIFPYLFSIKSEIRSERNTLPKNVKNRLQCFKFCKPTFEEHETG